MEDGRPSEENGESFWLVQPIEVVVGEQRLSVASERPTSWDAYLAHAAFVETEPEGELLGHLFITVHQEKAANTFPECVIDLAYEPAASGLRWGAALVPETGVLFIGAGERLIG